MLPGVCIACPKADHQNRFLDSRHFTICQRRGIRQISALSLFLEQFQRLWLGQHPEQLHPVKIVRYGLFPRPPQNAQAGTDLTVRCQFRFQFPADCTGKRRRIASVATEIVTSPWRRCAGTAKSGVLSGLTVAEETSFPAAWASRTMRAFSALSSVAANTRNCSSSSSGA